MKAIDPLAFIDALEARGATRWFGVPDSVLRGLGDALIATRPDRTIVTADEGAAIALAAGHWLATGEEAVVWMQNAGLGNAVNPLLSLVHEEVYDVPMWLVIGWRGAPGGHDEPQHRPQGRIQPELLRLLDLPWAEADGGTLDTALATLAGAHRKVVVVRPGGMAAFRASSVDGPADLPLRAEAIAAIVAAIPPEASVVVSTGMGGRELWRLRPGDPRDLLIVGSMGHASAVALGLALGQPARPVVLLDGDGALLMHLGTLATIARSRAANLVHVVLNNGVHDSVGGVPTGARSVDVPGLARAAGYRSAATVQHAEGITGAIAEALAAPGPRLLDVHIAPGLARAGAVATELPRPSEPLRDLGAAFARRLRG